MNAKRSCVVAFIQSIKRDVIADGGRGRRFPLDNGKVIRKNSENPTRKRRVSTSGSSLSAPADAFRPIDRIERIESVVEADADAVCGADAAQTRRER